MEDSSPTASTTNTSNSNNSNSNNNEYNNNENNDSEVATYSYEEFITEVNSYIVKGRKGDEYRQIVRNIQTRLGHGNPIRDKLLAIINRVKDGAPLEEMEANIVSIFPDAAIEPAKLRPKIPKSTRVKVGRKNTEAIDPSYIKTVVDWAAYYDRTNVRLGSDGSLEVVGDDGQVKTIPFQKGFDAVRGVTMRSELLRKKSLEHLAYLRETKKTTLAGLQDSFVDKERELLAATRAYRESVDHDADGSLARDVARINRELYDIHQEILNAKYESVSDIRIEPYPRAKIYPETHDDRVIQIVQNTNMETTIRSRTLGLDGEPLKELEVESDDENENDNESGNNESANSNESGSASESTPNTDSSNESGSASATNNSNESGSAPESTPNTASGNESGSGSASGNNDNNGNSNESAESTPASPDYFQELVDEIKTKLQTFTPAPETTIRELKAAIFTEERLAYYDTHIPDFRKRFTEAYLQATS